MRKRVIRNIKNEVERNKEIQKKIYIMTTRERDKTQNLNVERK